MANEVSLCNPPDSFCPCTCAHFEILSSVGPTSGAIAHLGKDNELGARLAIEELNAKGVTIGGKKAKFELLAEDDAGDPKQGTAAAQKLVDSKVNGVIGHLNSGTSIPAS
ncbi:ABC transporter substrate-binding protein, partial [Enterococcus faecium]|uniref:ABC transporter substrate-binding protein n=1 Tax=Enterococcus faecium TaxID=1352 RepID=UPI00376FAA48